MNSLLQITDPFTQLHNNPEQAPSITLPIFITTTSSPSLKSEQAEVVAVANNLASLSLSSAQKPIDQSLIPNLIEDDRSVRQLDLRVTVTTAELQLDWFGKLEALQTLALRIVQHDPFYRIVPFEQATLRCLTSLTIEDAYLHNGVIPSLTKLPLQRVSLQGCQLVFSPCQLTELAGCKELQYINLKDTKTPHDPDVVKGQIHLLTKKMPAAEIVPQDTLCDYTDYSKVLCPDKLLGYSYSFEELQKLTEWPKLDELLELGIKEEKYWEDARNAVYQHNRCEHPMASPIKCPDERLRVAIKEPSYSSGYAYWRFVLDKKVTVIVMVKYLLGTDCYPSQIGQSFHFGDNRDLEVKCIRQEYDPKTDRTLTELNVAGNKVYLLQINWKAFVGIDIQRLQPFLQEVQELEKLHPGTSVVHCQAGVGRTGTFFACMILEQLMSRLDKSHKLYFNLAVLLLALRQQRGSMIETVAQLYTVLSYLQWLIGQKETGSSLTQ